MKLKIAVLSGDGIGPEVTRQAIKALKAIAEYFKHEFEFNTALVGAIAIEKTGIPLPAETLKVCKESDTVLFGAIGSDTFDKNPYQDVFPEQGLLQLRHDLGLYANIRPVIVYNYLLDNSPLKKERVRGTNILIYREISAGVFYGKKGSSKDGTASFDTFNYTQSQISRISRAAFTASLSRRKKVTLIDKSNVLETSRLWRKTVLEVSKEFPEVELDLMYVDKAAEKIITTPKDFDVIVTSNLIGDFISEQASALVGSKGIMASASIGEKYSLFEPIHGTYPSAIQKGIANPTGAILSAVLLLKHFGLAKEATAIKKAVIKAMQLQLTTPDLNAVNPITTEKVGDFIADYILNPDLTDMNIENIYLGQSTII